VLIYRLLITLLAPVLLAVGLVRWLRGREDAKGLLGRIGLLRAPDRRRPTIWLHAASNGELASARPVLAAIRRLRPGHRVLITTNSLTGRRMARGLGDHARTAPFDLRWIVARVLRGWQVDAHVLVESEFWPNRLTLCARAGIPVVAIGARMSARTARGWEKRPGLARPVLGSLALVSCQDAESDRRLAALGLPEAARAPRVDLKALYDGPSTAPPPDPALARALPRAQSWLAASTHPGEDEIVLVAHCQALATRPDLRLVIAPRHPDRADEIARAVRARDLPLARRSAGAGPLDCGGAVYLADTLGEMPLWYQACGIVFIGGTLSDRGGHTPYEPAAFGCALIHGPDTRNFEAPFARLAEAEAAERIGDANSLARALLLHAGAPDAAGRRARAVLAPPGAAFDDLTARLDAVLPQDPTNTPVV